ncbi:MAG: AAA family ATPase [Herminiimonas sp.]|nr:AAA family ATPase [Herminiimonas sp.]
MYTRFFGLSQIPFSIAPDPRYLYMSERHREALAHLLYGLNGGGGFVLLTGEIGAGKTTVCRLFLEQIPPHCNVAYIFNPKQSVVELLQSICDEFHVATGRTDGSAPSVKDFIDPLNAYLLRTHSADQNNVLIIDEAQNLSVDVLEQLRLLTNLETNERKLLQIILIGQPELRAMLARPELEQLAQRVIARFHLGALTVAETAQYITHRLAVADLAGASPFNQAAITRIYQRARGIPRRINLLCDRALLGAYAGGRREVDARIIDRAAGEVFDGERNVSMQVAARWRLVFAGAIAGSLAVGAVVAGVGMSGTGLPFAGSVAGGNPGAKRIGGPAVSPAPKVVPAPVAPVIAPTETARALPVSVDGSARDLAAAYRRLAGLWGVSLTSGEPCRMAPPLNLNCFNSRKGLASIRDFDRPGLLTLHDDQDRPYYALLLGLGADRAVLRIGELNATVTLDALSRRWRGDFATFWRGPNGYEREVGKGDRGPVVDWVATQLAVIDGLAKPAKGQIYDDGLVARVRQFQLARGLLPDGMAGPQTFMRLSDVAGLSEPKLLPVAPALDSPSRK